MSTLAPKANYKHAGVLAGILAIHAGLIILFMLSPALHPPQHEKPPIELPVPLQMAMVELMQTPAPLPASPPPAGQPMAKPKAMPVPTAKQVPAKPAAPPRAVSPQNMPQATSVLTQSAPTASPVAATSERGISEPVSTATSSSSHQTSSSSGSTQNSHPSTSAAPTQGAGGISNSSSPPRFGAAYLNNPAPKYPALAKRLGEQGRVLLRVLVTSDGLAKEVRLHASSGSSLLDDSAVQAVRRWRFVPARQGDTTVEAWVQVPIVFKLD